MSNTCEIPVKNVVNTTGCLHLLDLLTADAIIACTAAAVRPATAWHCATEYLVATKAVEVPRKWKILIEMDSNNE